MRRIFLCCIAVVLASAVVGAQGFDEIVAIKGEPILDGRGIDTSTVTLESVNDADLSNVVINLIGENGSSDAEWWNRLTVELPVGWSIVSLDVEDAEPGSLYSTPTGTGVGTNVAGWYANDPPCGGFGFLLSADTNDEARFIITVDTTGGAGGQVTIPYMIEGDTWGSDPHVICSTTSGCGYDACYGSAVTGTAPDVSATVQQPPTPTPTPIEAIPTTTNVGLFVLIGLVLGAGVLVLMRRS
jgi:hypothetical protein